MLGTLRFTIVSADITAFAAVVLLLRNTFAHRVGFGNKFVGVPKPVAVIALWLAIAVPLTAGLFFVRVLMRG